MESASSDDGPTSRAASPTRRAPHDTTSKVVPLKDLKLDALIDPLKLVADGDAELLPHVADLPRARPPPAPAAGRLATDPRLAAMQTDIGAAACAGWGAGHSAQWWGAQNAAAARGRSSAVEAESALSSRERALLSAATPPRSAHGEAGALTAPRAIDAGEEALRWLTPLRNIREDVARRLLRPVQPGVSCECVVRRTRASLFRSASVRMYVESAGGGEHFILAARPSGSAHLLSRDESGANSMAERVGTLRRNFLGTQWALYDEGSAPTKTGEHADGAHARYRGELGLVTWGQNVWGKPMPRKSALVLPELVGGMPRVSRPPLVANSMLICAREHRLDPDAHMILVSREPTLDAATGRASLDFGGRVTCPSVKNVQLVVSGTDTIVLQFGRTGKDSFVLDFTWPLSPMQAFGFALSALSHKLASEGG